MLFIYLFLFSFWTSCIVSDVRATSVVPLCTLSALEAGQHTWKVCNSFWVLYEITRINHLSCLLPDLARRSTPKQSKMPVENGHWRLQFLYPVNRLARHEQTTILRLQTGHWSANASEANWHHGLRTLRCAKKQNRRPTTCSRTLPSGDNRDTSYGCRMSQPPTSCGERRRTCTAPPSSWQHVD